MNEKKHTARKKQRGIKHRRNTVGLSDRNTAGRKSSAVNNDTTKDKFCVQLTDNGHICVTGYGLERRRFGRHFAAEATGCFGRDRSQN